MKTFKDLINSDQLTLVDFFAEWCGPCKTMKPILEDLKRKIGNKATIIKIDVDKNQDAAAAYSIRSVPTLMLFKSGKIVWQQAGVVTSNDLAKIIESH